MRLLTLLLALPLLAQNKAIFPPDVKPIGPYSPAVQTATHVYVSGQAGKTVDETLGNIEKILKNANLTLDHVAQLEIYLASLSGVEETLQARFPKGVPAHVVVQVARIPTDAPVEINAVAVRELKNLRKVANGMATGDRIFVNARYGDKLEDVLRGVRTGLRADGSAPEGLLHLVAFYVADQVREAELTRFEKSKIVTAFVPVQKLPNNAKVALAAVAAKARPEGEPRRDCREFQGTLYCAMVLPSTPGSIEEQTKATLNAVKTRLSAHGFSLDDVVASHVFLNDLGEFTKMNAVYVEQFPGIKPSRTTLQPVSVGAGNPGFRIWVVAEK